jgi:exopolysaccharide biosynthesis predicted pyruvyltransferase EpsI
MSYKIAKEALPGVMSYPFPDIVTTLIGRTTFEKKQRKGVLLCARHDEEGIFSKENLLFLKKSLEQIDYVDTIDTTIEAPSQLFIRRNREKYVYKMINLMHDHKVVVTDRYHGLIFSIVANTPVVLLKTIDHKITEGVNWFPEEIRRYICFAETLEEAADLVKKLSEGHKFIADDYFYKKYYSELKNLFDDINSWLAED